MRRPRRSGPSCRGRARAAAPADSGLRGTGRRRAACRRASNPRTPRTRRAIAARRRRAAPWRAFLCPPGSRGIARGARSQARPTARRREGWRSSRPVASIPALRSGWCRSRAAGPPRRRCRRHSGRQARNAASRCCRGETSAAGTSASRVFAGCQRKVSGDDAGGERGGRRPASQSLPTRGAGFPMTAATAPALVAERPERASRANATSCAEWNRCSGLFSMQCRTIRSRPGEHALVRDGKVRRLFPEDRRHRLRGRVAVECSLAREHLVENRAEREDVASGVGRLAFDLLRRHVAERPEHDARLRGAGRRRQARGRGSPRSASAWPDRSRGS